MSAFDLVDAFVRGGTLALLALFSLILLRDHREALAGRVAVAMNLAIAAHVLVTIPSEPLPRAIDIALDGCSVLVPALFWLFARAWFGDERRIGWLGWSSIPFTLLLLTLVYLKWQDGSLLFAVAATLLRLTMFGFALAGLWVAWRGREGDLIEARRRIRWRLVGAVGLFVVLTNAIEVLVSFGVLESYWRSLIEYGILVLTFLLCAAIFGTRHPDLLGQPERAEPQAGPALSQPDPLAERLLALMELDKPHRDETLTIAALAARLGEQEYRLRRTINRALGHRNFAQFLNGYRLAEVRDALADPTQREVPILTIALDAGFGSLGPFNRAFRDAEGITPSAWRARAIADSGIG